MKISFLIHDVCGIGGTITTTFNLARALADRHDVEIVSVLRSTTVHARLHGARLAGGAVVRLRLRRSGADLEQSVPVDAGADGRDFGLLVDHRALATGTPAGTGFGRLRPPRRRRAPRPGSAGSSTTSSTARDRSCTRPPAPATPRCGRTTPSTNDLSLQVSPAG